MQATKQSVRRHRAVSLFGAALLTVQSLWIGAAAQDYKQVAPNVPAPRSGGSVSVGTAEQAVPPVPHKLLLSELKGLRFVANIKDVARDGAPGAGISIVGADLAPLQNPELQLAIQGFLGKPLYTDDLPKISNAVLSWYRSHDLPVVDVIFPEQNITNGTVQAVVTVYRLGKVKVEGNRWFSASTLSDELQIEPGRPIDVAVLKSDLNRLNRNPFRQVNAVLQRSETVGDTDLVLRVDDALPLRVYASYDNNGQPVTGRDRYSVGLNWGNVFGLDHQFSYSFLTSADLWGNRNRGAGHSDAPRLTAHSVNYLAPLPWGDFLNVFGSYVEQVPNLGPYFDQVGHSLQMSLRYQRDLPVIWGTSQQIQIGFDYKRSDNNLAFGGTRIFGNATNVQQFLLVYGGTRPDSWGQTAVENQLVFSPGGLSDGNRTPVFVGAGVNGARADYVYDNLQITRVFFLPQDFSTVIRFDGQIASAELLPSEQLGAGGAGSVRGYDPRAFNGTQGMLASLELRSPSFHLIKDVLGPSVDDSAQILAFYDSAFVSDLHGQTVQAKSATLQSAGLGFRYSINRNFNLSFDYGWQLNAPPGGSSRDGLMELSLTISN